MKVLVVNGGFPLDKVGGSELQTFFIGRSLVESGDDVTYLAISSSADSQDEVVSGMAVRRFAKTDSRSRRRRLLAELMDDGEFDVCYVRIISWLHDVVHVARRKGIPVVANVASDLDLEIRPVLRPLFAGRVRTAWNQHMLNRGHRAFSLCDAVVAQTTMQLRSLEHLGVRSGVVIRNMFPDEVPSPAPTEMPEVIAVGSIKSVKRPEIFFRLAECLSDTGANFVVIGEIQDPDYRAIVDEALASNSHLVYEGVLPVDEAWRRIASARVLVNTSSHEGFSNTFIQAWLAGVPVITYGVDPDGLIASHGLGYACSTEEELADSVREVLTNPSRRSEISLRAREYALAEHTVAVCGPRFRELFLRVAGVGE